MVTEGWGHQISDDVIKLLQDGNAYLQHNNIGDKDMSPHRWYWNTSVVYGNHKKVFPANMTYTSVKHWLSFCGCLGSGAWRIEIHDKFKPADIRRFFIHYKCIVGGCSTEGSTVDNINCYSNETTMMDLKLAVARKYTTDVFEIVILNITQL